MNSILAKRGWLYVISILTDDIYHTDSGKKYYQSKNSPFEHYNEAEKIGKLEHTIYVLIAKEVVANKSNNTLNQILHVLCRIFQKRRLSHRGKDAQKSNIEVEIFFCKIQGIYKENCAQRNNQKIQNFFFFSFGDIFDSRKFFAKKFALMITPRN